MPQSNFDIHDELNDPKKQKYCIFNLGLLNVTVLKRKLKAKFKVFIIHSAWKKVKMCFTEPRLSSDMSSQIHIFEACLKLLILEMERSLYKSVLNHLSKLYGKLTHIVAINMTVIQSSSMINCWFITSAQTATWILLTKVQVFIWILL